MTNPRRSIATPPASPVNLQCILARSNSPLKNGKDSLFPHGIPWGEVGNAGKAPIADEIRPYPCKGSQSDYAVLLAFMGASQGCMRCACHDQLPYLSFPPKKKSISLTPCTGPCSVNLACLGAHFVKDSPDKHSRGTSGAQSGSVDSSLLQRLKAKSPEAWRRLVYLFGPTIYQQCRCSGLQAADASDVSQDVFRAVATHIGNFRRDGAGNTFRGWLWTITRNKIADHRQHQQKHPEARGGTDAQIWLADLVSQGLVEIDAASEPQPPGSLYQRALKLLQHDFEERTWKAFWRVAVDNCTPADVADELDMSINAVYIAKTRVLRRLREELGDLLD